MVTHVGQASDGFTASGQATWTHFAHSVTTFEVDMSGMSRQKVCKASGWCWCDRGGGV